MFKALMGGGRSSSDVRSTASSSSKSSRRKTGSKSTSSRKSSRGDDRDRGLGDLSAYPPASGSRRGPSSTAEESIVSSYVTAEPDEIDTSSPTIIERAPKRRDSDRESTRRRRDRDRSESRERERRKSRRSTTDGLDYDLDRERDRLERRRTQSGDPYVPPISTSMPPSAPGAQFATDIAAPGFSQFPMQYDNAMPPASFPPGHDSSPAPYDPHVHQQFPGQFPTDTAEPYRPPNPAGAAADYYGDQGQSVAEQPGVRPSRPPVIPNSQAHLMAASPSANPPPEPSSLGQVGAAASYFAEDAQPVQSEVVPSSGSSSKPPKPGKPGKPSKPSSSSAIPAAAAAGAAAYGVGSGMTSYEEPQYASTPLAQSSSYPQPTATGSTSKPPHSYGVGTGIGVAAAGAAAGYMLGHHHDHPSSPAHSSQYTYQNFEQSSQAGAPYGSGTNQAMMAAGAAGYAAHAAHSPGYYPIGAGGLAMQHRHRGPLSKFVDFWRDPEGVGRFEDYTETIGVCKYCFDPGTSSLDAPRKHHYHRRRRHSADRYSSSSSSRVNKLSRYHSSEDERGRRHKSKKSSSWLPGMLAGYAAKSIFTGKDFDESYSVRSGRPSRDQASSFDGDTISYTSRGVVRRSGRSSPGEYYYNKKDSPRTRSRSRSSSGSGHHSFVKEAALGAAVGSATLAVSKSHQRSRSRSPSRTQRRKDSSSSSSFIDVSRPPKKSAGLVSFFTSSSENRKKKQSKRPKSFFSFRSSSSSSLDNDLAFGTGFAKKVKDKKKKGKAKKDEDLDAALLGLGATATALAASSHGRSRSTGQILTRSRHSNSASSANEDDEWVDADSEDQSSSSVSSALAFGASSEDSGSDSSSGRWGWILGSKKKKKDKKASAEDAALAAGAGALGGAALASVARQRDSRASSSAGSLQQVYPVPTSDPSRYDVVKMSPSVISCDQPPLVRPGPIPLQQPQPVTPVSQAVYTTQGSLPGSIPVYSTPAAVPPIFANEYDRYDPQFQGPRDAAWFQDNRRQSHRRSDSSPVFSTKDSYASSLKRQSTTKDQASVSFDLTEEQAERERRLNRRDKRSRDEFRDEPVQLIDREEEWARQDSERRSRRRKESRDEKRDDDKEKDSSKWVEAAAVGAVGAAPASSLASSRKTDDDVISEASSRPRDNRQRRRAERRYVSEREAESSIVSKPEVEVAQPVEERETSVENREDQEKRSSRRGSRVYDDYAEFFAPEEVRHSPDEHSRRRDSGDSNEKPTIIEVVPASERQKYDPMNDDTRDLPVFGPEPYENHDHLPWQVPRLNIIEPTPPQSISGSVRGASSPVAPLDEIPEEEPKDRERPSTGSRVSWGPHETHEYEVPSSSEPEFSPPPEDFQEISAETSEKQKSKDVGSKPDFGHDIEFAATVAAATEAAGFDPSYVIDDPKYHTRTSPPGSEDEGTFSPRSKWTTPQDEPRDFVGFVEGEVETPGPDKSKDVEPFVEHVEDKAVPTEPESISRDTAESSQRGDRSAIAQKALEQLNGNRERNVSHEDDVFSMPGGFETGAKFREVSDSRDDSRSVFSAPVVRESETPTKSRKSRRSGDDFDLPRDTASPPLEEDAEAGEEKKKRRKRHSKRYSDTFPVDDDARSAVTAYEDEDKSERRKHRHRSSRDKDLDDAASITSSPAKLEETKEKRRSKDSKDLKDKGSSGFLRNLFGSRVPEPAGQSHSRSSSLDKQSSREAMSEAGIDDERRRRKKRSSRHRSSSGGDRLDDDGSDRDIDVKDDTNLEEYRSNRQKKEEKRRHRYEEIVESGRRRESEKGEKTSDYKDEPDRSFLGERPELPAAAERDERGASGLEESVEGAAFAAAGLGLSEEILHQRHRSRSTSPPAAEKALDLAPRSHSRPSSPEASRDKNESPRNRRSSMARSSTESPTAVPLHFRRPPTSPGLHRSVPSGGSPTAATGSPSSPSQTRHRRLNSVEFRNSREIRPLWLVERHGAAKGEPVEDDEPLPSLPSSKTSSRATSVEDLRTLHDEDAVQSWDAVDLSQSMGARRRPTGLTISTDQANRDGDGDLLDSQQATPTAEDFGPAVGSAKKEKPKYEFHSPSELLQDPSMYPEMPPSPTMEALPSAEGSVVGVKDSVEGGGQGRSIDFQERPVTLPEAETPTQERSSFLGEAGPGFAGVVDAAVMAAVKEGEKPTAEAGGESSPSAAPKLGGFADVVNAAVAKEVSQEKTPADDALGEPGTAVEEQPPQTLEAAPIEASKDLAPEVTEQQSEPAQEKPAEEPATEEVATTSSSKKKKKKKGKKGSASQSVDLTPSESAPVIEEQAPAVEATKGEARSVEPEAAPATVEQEPTVQTEAKSEPVESPRELGVEAEPAAASESVEAAPAIESKPEPESENIPTVPAEAEAVSTHDPQPEASASANVPAEPEQPEDTAALSKKAKRDKKKQKKKAKSAAAAEEVAQPSDAIASEETPVQSEEKGVEDTQESKEIPQTDEIAATDELTKDEGSKEIDTAGTPVPAEQETSEFQEAREVAEPPEPTSVEDVSKVDEKAAIETSAPDAQEGDLAQATPAETIEESRAADEPAQSAEKVPPTLPTDETPALEKPEETEEDNFQEAFEQQPVPTEEPKEVPSEPSGEVVAESAAPIEPQGSKTEEDRDEQPKKKSKKKKNRKSVSFEEPETPSEPRPTSEPEPEQTKEIKPEQSAPAEPAGIQVSPAGGETLPSEAEQPVQDVSEVASGEPVPSQEPESASAPDAEPIASTEQAEPLGASREISTAAAEPEPEVPMTAAQKKKAKKEKKKAKQQSVSSVSEEKPVESPSIEAQSTEETLPTESQPVEPRPVEPQPTEEAQSAEPQPVEPQAELEAVPTDANATKETPPPGEPVADTSAPEEKKEDATEPEQLPEKTASIPDAESAIEGAVAEPSQEEPKAQDEAPVEEPAAEPEVPMTAAQKKKAKKAKKKQQQQQAALSPAADEAQATETAAAPEAQPAPEAESRREAEPAPDSESAEVSKDVEAAPEPEASAPPSEPTASTNVEPLEPSADGPPVSEEVVLSADAPAETEKKDELPEVEQPKEDGSSQEPSVEAPAAAEEANAPKEASEAAPAEPEVPMTAAQKQKAKKEKKKQQKRQSMQLEEQPSPDSKPAASSEQKETEQAIEVSPEPTTPAEEPSSTAKNMKASDDVTAAVEVTPAEAESEPKAETTPDDELNQAATTEQKDVAAETPVDATASPEQPPTEEAVSESTPVSIPDTSETAPAESQDAPTEEATTLQKSLHETDAPAEPAPEAATSQEPTTPVPAEAGTLEQTQQPETTPKSKKDKKKKKKRQSLALEEESQPEPAKEESTELVSAENVEEPASIGEAEMAATTEEPPKPEESISETPEKVEPQAPSEDAETTTVTEEPSKPEESVREESPKDETVLAPPVAEAEAAPGPEFEVPMTAAQKKKAKKDKKKRQSLALAEDTQPEIQAEAVKEEPQEAAPAENVEAPGSSQAAEPATATGELSKPEEPVPEESPKDETPPDQPVVEAEAAPEPEPEVPMTAAQKKAKKDKKKRKSVSWEGEASAVSEQQPLVSEQTTDTRDQPGADAPSQELGKTPTDTEGPVQESTTADVAESSTSPVEVPENKPEDAVETMRDSAEATPSTDAPPEESEGPVASESSATLDSKEPEVKPLDQAPSDEQPEHTTDSKTSPEEQPVVPEEPTETAETTEPAAEVTLSAKERRKLKKKEKKKGKSVDLTAEAPATEASQEAEVPQAAEPEAAKPEESQETGSENIKATKEVETEASKTGEKDTAIEDNAAVEQKAEEKETDTTETLQPAEPDTTKTEIKLAVSEEPLESNKEDVQVPTTETTTEPEPAPSKDTENQTEQSPEPEPEVALSAKERRKLKKKEKKRQSKNLDADDDAAPKESPSAVPTEPAQDSTLSETAPTESGTAAAEPLAAESDIPAPTDNDTREISKPVTAPSPAEDDGKEHQSHDILPSDAPANDLTSTDEFVSSQVEQPQLESRSSDYPPQPVLERSIDFGDESGEVQKEVDVEPVASEAEVPTITEEKPVDVGKGDVAMEEGESKDVPVQEPRPDESDGVVEKESPVTEEVPVSEPPVEETSQPTAVEDGSAQQEPVAEEVIQPALSKKQKKKDKKKKQKQQEEKIEEAPAGETELPVTGEAEQPAAAPATPEATEAKADVEPEQVQESTTAPVVEGPPTEQKDDTIESPEPHPSEENVSSAEAKPIDEEPKPIEDKAVVPETEQVEASPLSRKLSKKKKQRQALLTQQADAEEKPEEQLVSEAGEASAPTIEPVTEHPSGEATVEPEEEWPTVSRKKSKKEKKKAAAAAAALAIEEDKPAEPQPTLDEPSNTQEISEAPKELPTNDEAQQEPIESEQRPESVKEDVVNRSEPVSESVENAIEPPQEASEAAPEPDSKAEDATEEAAATEPVTRKLSKEKRKAKKQAKQEPLDAVAAPTDGTPVENVTELEVEQPAAEDPLTTEVASAENPKETVLEPETATQMSLVEPVPESVLETSENTEAAIAPQPEQPDAEIPQPDEESKETEAVVSLDPFDVPSSAEEKEQEISAEPDPNTGDVPSQDAEAEMTEEQKDEAEAKLKARALEKEADLEVAAELFEDRPREQEVVAAPFRKLSKKEKRKAKKKGILEESPLEQEQEAVPEAPAAESKEAEDPTPAPQEPESVSTEIEAAPELTKEPELVPEASKETESTSEPQPAAETDLTPESEPTVAEPAAEEPEPELSRKASKKKAKKAKKAALALDLGTSPETATETQETVVSPAEKASDKTRDVKLAGQTQEEPKHDDEEWPSIEWEQAKSDKQEPSRDPISEPEPVAAVPEAEAIGEFDESAIPEALQEAKQGPEPAEEESWSVPLSNKDKEAKKNKRKSEQAALAEESAPKPSHKKVELASDVQPGPALDPTVPKETEVEPPIRTTTPGGSKVANLFPGLERGGFRRSALKKDSPSLKDSAEEENAADQEVNREIAIPVLEAPLATTETKDEASTGSQLPTQEGEVTPTTTDRDAPIEDVATKDQSIEETELPVPNERTIAEEFPSPAHPASKERSSMLFGSSPSTRTEEPSTPRHLLPSQIEGTDESPSGLRRTPSVIHGRHQQTARTWSLEEPSLQALRTPSPPRSLFGGPYGEDTHSRPRTPLHPIAEQEPGDTTLSGTPRLEVKPEHVLPRPVTPVRKFTDNALARESWPTSENDSGSGSQDSPRKSPKLSEQGMPILKPSSSKGKLRRTTRSTSGDLRAVSQALDSQPPRSDLDQLPSSSSYDPVTDKGKRPLRNMADVYEGWGETPSSPRSPSRPPSVRRRRSMQHLQDLEARLDQLISENRLLVAARDEAEDRLRKASVARRKSDQALNTRGADLRDKEAEVEQLKSSVEWLQTEMSRLTQENEGLMASNAALAAAHAAEVNQVRETSARELGDLRSQYAELSTNMEDRVRQEIESALAQKDAELRRLREELEDARDKVKELQQQIAASVHDNVLVFRDEDYFDAACQKLCGHVQQWVLRFSKHSDHRRCRSLGDLHDEKIADRFDNALLDGSDADAYLADRVRRRDVFMSVVMTMIWEYIFTRYLFGMDREQRQKLKSLEKQLGEVGPQRAVHRWRATTLTLLSRRPAFASQRQSDTEAVALEIFGTLSRVLPPPSHVESQLLDSLRKVLRVAVNLSLEMRTQLAEFIMLPPLQPEYDTNGDLARQVYFNASLMNERSGETSSNEELEAQHAVVRIVLFPLVVKKGNDVGEGDDEVVVCPAQVLVARPDKRVSKMKSGDRMSIDAARSVHSVAPSIAPSTMDMSNVI